MSKSDVKEKPSILEMLKSPERQTKGSSVEEFELLGNFRSGINEETGETVTSFSAFRVATNENCRVAFPSQSILEKIDQFAKVEDGKIKIKVRFDLTKRKGTYWVDAVLPFE